MFNRKPNPRYQELTSRVSVLVGEPLAEVWYHDGVTENGNPIFSEHPTPGRHELMQGVDLVVKNNISIGIYWNTYRKPGDYELDIVPGGLTSKLHNGWNRFDQTQEEHWSTRIGKTILRYTFSQDVRDNHRMGYICDCRIDFVDADPVWICTRCANDNCQSSGDDTIVIFERPEAERLGIRVDAE